MTSQFWPEISTCLNEVEKEKVNLSKKAINLDSLTTARDNINRILDRLHISFEQSLDKQYASQALFAIVAYLDEQIHGHLLEKGIGNWVPLQKDFYGAYNAGNLFYDTIDKLIEDPQVPEIVFRIFYFILKKGFIGKYRDSKTHIAKYMEILKDKISVITATHEEHKDIKISSLHTKKQIVPWHYYAGAGAISLMLLGLLYFTSNL